MNLTEAKAFFININPDKEVIFSFDDLCQRSHEISYTNGLPNPINHVEYNKLKVSVAGMKDVYCPIQAHRETISWIDLKKIVDSKNECYKDPETNIPE